MSQKSVLIALTVAIVLYAMTVEAEAKRVGCASFGHSCYGGHGKRSEPAMPSQEIDASEIQQQQQPPIAIMRILQRRLNLHSEPMTNELMEGEREVKITILAVLKDVVDETYRKLTTKDQDIPT